MSKKKITKSIEIDVSEIVTANITLSINEIVEFIESCNNIEKQEIINALNISSASSIKLNSIEDIYKMELLTELFNKYSLPELQAII